jgi:hypothetical protein
MCYCVCFKCWLRVYYGLDLLLSKLSKAQVAASSESGTPLFRWLMCIASSYRGGGSHFPLYLFLCVLKYYLSYGQGLIEPYDIIIAQMSSSYGDPTGPLAMR